MFSLKTNPQKIFHILYWSIGHRLVNNCNKFGTTFKQLRGVWLMKFLLKSMVILFLEKKGYFLTSFLHTSSEFFKNNYKKFQQKFCSKKQMASANNCNKFGKIFRQLSLLRVWLMRFTQNSTWIPVGILEKFWSQFDVFRLLPSKSWRRHRNSSNFFAYVIPTEISIRKEDGNPQQLIIIIL